MLLVSEWAAGSVLSCTVVVLGTSTFAGGSDVDRARHALLLQSSLPLDAPQKPALMAVGRGMFNLSPMKVHACMGLGPDWENQIFWMRQAGKARWNSQCHLFGFWGHVVSKDK